MHWRAGVCKALEWDVGLHAPRLAWRRLHAGLLVGPVKLLLRYPAIMWLTEYLPLDLGFPQANFELFHTGFIGLDHGVGHFRPLSITRQRHLLAYHGMQ